MIDKIKNIKPGESFIYYDGFLMTEGCKRKRAICNAAKEKYDRGEAIIYQINRQPGAEVSHCDYWIKGVVKGTIHRHIINFKAQRRYSESRRDSRTKMGVVDG